MGGFIKIKETTILKNRISIDFDVSEDLKRFFKNNTFWAEYNVDVTNVPEGIAIIPFVTNILPIIWLTDSELIVKDLDDEFFQSINEFKKGYVKMYPTLDFKGTLNFKRKTQHVYNTQKIAMFFSGGADAFCTLVSHINECPDLITVWGADIKPDDEDTWEKIKLQNENTAKELGLHNVYIHSVFTQFLNQDELDTLVKSVRDNWWHGMQHGIGLIGLAAPVSYVKGYKIIYIASSFTITDKVTCASDPSIDNNVKFGFTRIIHDGYEFCRQAKLNIIGKYSYTNNKRIFLRVCYKTTGGVNCCICEKCLRTAIGLYVLGYDPRLFGFEKDNLYRDSKYRVITRLDPILIRFWENIQQSLKNQSEEKLPSDLKWLKTCDFSRDPFSFKTRIIRYLRRKLAIK